MKKMLGITALFLGTVASSIAITASPAAAATGKVTWGNNGVGRCNADPINLAMTTPSMTVYGLGSTADTVRAYYRLLKTDGSVAVNWLSMGSGAASTTRPLNFGTAQLTFPVLYFGGAYLQLQTQVQWFSGGVLSGYQNILVNSYDYYGSWPTGYLARVSSCQG